MEKKYEIQEWNCEKQRLEAPRKVTLAEYRAMVDASTAKAREIHASHKAN